MENTVLILGAGFSKPYGYPVGSEIVDSIIAQGLISKNFLEVELAGDLKNNSAYSIDKFLSEHPRHLRAGLSKIVQEILKAEIKSLNHPVNADDDIIRKLLNDLSVDEFEKLRIITFNYDRLIERSFLKNLGTARNKNDAYNTFSKLKIEHIHGRMPSLRDLEPDLNPLTKSYGMITVFRKVSSGFRLESKISKE